MIKEVANLKVQIKDVFDVHSHQIIYIDTRNSLARDEVYVRS